MNSGFFQIPLHKTKNKNSPINIKSQKKLINSSENTIKTEKDNNLKKYDQRNSQKTFPIDNIRSSLKKQKSLNKGISPNNLINKDLKSKLKMIFEKKGQFIKNLEKLKKPLKKASPSKQLKKINTNEKNFKLNSTNSKIYKNMSLEQIAKKSSSKVLIKNYNFKTQKTPKKQQNSLTKNIPKKKSPVRKNEDSKTFFTNVKKNNQEYLTNFYHRFFAMEKSQRKGYKFTLVDKEGCRVTHFAVWYNNRQLIGFLLANEVDFNKQNKDGITPLMLAILKGHKHLVSLLSKITEDINLCDNSGNSVLHYAVVKENLDIVKLFLEIDNIDVHLKNKDNKTCLDLAHPRIFVELKSLLNTFETNKKIGKKEIEIQKENTMENNAPGNDFKKRNTSNKRTVHIFPNDNSKKKEIFENVNLDSFIIHSCIGQGSFGEVFLVEKKDTNYFYAMKVLEKEKVFKDNLKKYVLTERNVLSVINHPFIVKLRFAFQNKHYLFLIMDYYPGGDLGEYLEIEGNFSEERAKIYVAELILALEELHRNDIIFRDLKPENIVLDNQGHALLIDFGLSKANVRSQYKGAKSFCGSVAYLAPEMIKKKGHGKSMDWYLLGVLLYELLVGIPPFYDDSKEVLFSNIQYAKLEIPGFFSNKVKDLLFGLLERNPTKRLTVEEIKNHPWFENIKWEDVLNRKLDPPKPMMKKVKLFAIKKKPKFMNEQGKNYSSLNGWTFIEPEEKIN